MSHSFADDAIALLIDLAQRGEIDPWDVNVVEVFDRFLSELSLTSSQDLATSGQAFLYASMLILLKAESLAGLNPAEDLVEEGFNLFDSDNLEFQSQQLPLRLEEHIHRRPVAHPFPRRRVTLGELIQQLELIAVAVDRQSRQGRVVKKVVRPTKAQSIKAIAGLSHTENMSEVAVELERLFQEQFFQGTDFQGTEFAENWIDFEFLIQFNPDRVGLFWALLLLSAQNKVELDQKEFYQDLRLRPVQLLEGIASLPLQLPDLKSAQLPDLKSAAS